MSYDQWKTASPYDDEPDNFVYGLEKAEAWLERNPFIARAEFGCSVQDARTVIEMLLSYIKEEI